MLICGAAVCTAACAQVSLDSCRSMALHNNKAIRMASAGVAQAAYANKAARAAYLPGLDFTGGYMLNQNQIELLGADAMLPTMKFNPLTMKYEYNLVRDPVSGQPLQDPTTGQAIPSEVAVIPKDAMSFDTHNVFAGAFTLTQPVYMGGQIRAMNTITKYAENLAREARNAAVQEVVFAVDEAYWLVVSLAEKKRLAESFVALVDSLKHNVDVMMREGVATRSDVLTVEVKLNEANIALTKVDNGLTLSRMALAQLCGLPVDSRLQLTDEALADDRLPTPTMAGVNMESVYADRPDLGVLRAGIGLMLGKEKLAMGAMLPKVAIVGTYAFSNPNVIHGFQKRFGGGFSVGATLTVPLWHWGGNYYQYRSAKAQTAMQRLLLEDAEEKVELQVSQARFKYDEAFKTLAMTRTNMRKSDENLRQAQLAFREGVLTADDVIAAQTAWLQAHSEKIDAAIGVRLCDAYLSKVTGRMAGYSGPEEF